MSSGGLALSARARASHDAKLSGGVGFSFSVATLTGHDAKLSGGVGLPLSVRDARRKRFHGIELGRVTAKISIEALTARAGTNSSYYRELRGEKKLPSERTLAALERALKSVKRSGRSARSAEHRLIKASYGGFLAVICQLTGLDVARVRAADPSRGRNAGAEGPAIARARMLAVYLTNTAIDVPQRALADVIGVSPAAICLALKTIEDLRDEDQAFTALLNAAAAAVTGESE